MKKEKLTRNCPGCNRLLMPVTGVKAIKWKTDAFMLARERNCPEKDICSRCSVNGVEVSKLQEQGVDLVKARGIVEEKLLEEQSKEEAMPKEFWDQPWLLQNLYTLYKDKLYTLDLSQFYLTDIRSKTERTKTYSINHMLEFFRSNILSKDTPVEDKFLFNKEEERGKYHVILNRSNPLLIDTEHPASELMVCDYPNFDSYVAHGGRVGPWGEDETEKWENCGRFSLEAVMDYFFNTADEERLKAAQFGPSFEPPEMFGNKKTK